MRMFQFKLAPNYAFGLAHVRIRDYFVASFVSMALGVLAYTYLRYAGREAALRRGLRAGASREGVTVP